MIICLYQEGVFSIRTEGIKEREETDIQVSPDNSWIVIIFLS